MYASQTWVTPEESIAYLSERDQSEYEQEYRMERKAESIRKQEKNMYDFDALDNEQKLEILKKWYPRAYRDIEKFYPGFISYPNDFPAAYARAINNMIVNIVWEFRHELAFC